MDRLRSTKLRAKRIEMDYFARRAPLRTWRVVLSLVALGAAAAWIAIVVLRGHRQAFEPGPVSAAHALFGIRCEACHDGAVQAAVVPPRWQAATDAACQRCHREADHETNQTSTPACGSCHTEHRGQKALAAVPAATCVACHGQLDAHVKGAPRVVGTDARAIRGFADGHPEFAVWTSRDGDARRVRLDATPPPADGTQLMLNHKQHLQARLRGPTGPAQLACGDCHEGGFEARPAGDGASPADAPDLAPAEKPAYMAPVRYARHCASCHPNTFDPRFPDMPAPHERPEVIHAFLRGLSADHAMAHPDALADPRRQILGREAAVSSSGEWTSRQVAEAERFLFRDAKRCAECHTLSWAEGASLPTVAPTRAPVRWLPQSRFDHGTHRLLACGECHAAETSERTTDVLMPRAGTCRSCHRPEGAADRCSECHTYHAATGPREMNGRQRVRELSAGSTAATGY